jgi:hypothetical protein
MATKRLNPKTLAAAVDQALGADGKNQLQFNQEINEKLNTAIGDLANLSNKVSGMVGFLQFRGKIPSDEWTDALTNHKKGDTFVVITAGTYVGQKCNPGDAVICETDGTTERNDDWFVMESNQPNMVLFADTEPMFEREIPIFGDMTGKKLNSSGVPLDRNLMIASDNQINVGAETALSPEQSAGIKKQFGIDSLEKQISNANSDITALKNGTTPSGSAKKLAMGRTIDGVSFDGTKDITHYGVCTSPADAEIKEVTIEGINLKLTGESAGTRIAVLFGNGNTHATPKIKVNSSEAVSFGSVAGNLANLPQLSVLDMVLTHGSNPSFLIVGISPYQDTTSKRIVFPSGDYVEYTEG